MQTWAIESFCIFLSSARQRFEDGGILLNTFGEFPVFMFIIAYIAYWTSTSITKVASVTYCKFVISVT